MPVLKDQRHEAFAQHVASGLTGAESAQRVGCKGNAARVQASRWLAKANIANRVAELKQAAAAVAVEKTGITKAAVLEELARIGFANMQDYMVVGSDGVPALNWKGLTREQAAALVEVTVDENKIGDVPSGKKIKFKLGDKRAALVDIGKELGMFADKSKERERGPLGALTDAQLDALVTRLAGQLTAEERAALGFAGEGEAANGKPTEPVSPLH